MYIKQYSSFNGGNILSPRGKIELASLPFAAAILRHLAQRQGRPSGCSRCCGCGSCGLCTCYIFAYSRFLHCCSCRIRVAIPLTHLLLQRGGG